MFLSVFGIRSYLFALDAFEKHALDMMFMQQSAGCGAATVHSCLYGPNRPVCEVSARAVTARARFGQIGRAHV